MNDLTPSPNGANGRQPNGRFAPGNAGGPGNPFARRVATLRSALLEAITPEDVTEIVRKLVEMAKAGDIAAAREVLTRVIGKPADAVDPDRLDVGEIVLERLREGARSVYTEDLTHWYP
jgi:hypothetical protein